MIKIMKEIISRKFKPVLNIDFEDDFMGEYIETGEVWKQAYPPIMYRDDIYGSTKRCEKIVTIRFTDNTGFKLRLKPEDYLTKIREIQFETDEGYGCKGLHKTHKREIDVEKVLNTILYTLKNNKRKENISLEMLDL